MSFKTNPILVNNASAICHDCQKSVASGTLEINLGDYLWASAVATGQLFFACAQHHDENRKWGQQDLPQHSDFTIKQGGKTIGEFTVATMVSEVGLRVADPEIQRKLSDEARTIRRSKEGF
ncbi:hypothetical protein HY357_02570 [Candidatus Roizmanbacteria bacterium]|nr:hypothetical protein [Candidatus Roizmanbacteria bacterium]